MYDFMSGGNGFSTSMKYGKLMDANFRIFHNTIPPVMKIFYNKNMIEKVKKKDTHMDTFFCHITSFLLLFEELKSHNPAN